MEKCFFTSSIQASIVFPIGAVVVAVGSASPASATPMIIGRGVEIQFAARIVVRAIRVIAGVGTVPKFVATTTALIP